ncbi:hypothetical protein [Hyphomicrobium sp.]|uniref:hypothetical protein n=1 Tax=Hyphomicrobium sp. TaxID=82 RepID=UPI002E36D488|nr:hypothetical protein [Hyphomicrobium sp.]HEX2843532.1 hypothetical protein [Hyphomicrobium sp.]
MHNPARPKRFAALAALALGACASQSGELAAPVTPVAETVTRLPPASGYQMKPDELALDCKKLTGRMAVRIVQIRDYQTRHQTTALSRSIQSTTTSVMGGSKEGTDPEGRYARDRAQLEAFNQRLAEKNCANFDLNAELDPNAKDPPRTRRLNKS